MIKQNIQCENRTYHVKTELTMWK